MNKYHEKLVYISLQTSSIHNDIWDFETNDPVGHKIFYLKNKEIVDLSVVYTEKSKFSPEYSVLRCVSVGFFEQGELKIKSITGTEKEIIKGFAKIMINFSKNAAFGLCGFSLKNFELPYLNKKIISYGYKIPVVLRTYNIKPWEMNAEDISEIWRFNGFERKLSSLVEIAHYLKVDNKKLEMLLISYEDEKNNLRNIKNEDLIITNENRLEIIAEISEKLFKSIRG